MAYLCLLANILAIEMLMANETIAMAIPSPINTPKSLDGGKIGAGIL